MTNEELNALQVFFLTARPDHTTLSQKGLRQVQTALEELESRRRDASEIEIREVEANIRVRVTNQMRKNGQEFLEATAQLLECASGELFGAEDMGSEDKDRLRKWHDERKARQSARPTPLTPRRKRTANAKT